MKRILYFLAVFLLATSVAAATSNEISISDTIEMDVAEMVSVPITITGSTGISAGQMDITYDPSVIRITGGSEGDLTWYYEVKTADAANGVVTVFALESGDPITGDMIFGYIDIQAVGTPSSMSDLTISSVIMANDHGETVVASTSDGHVTIIDPSTPPVVTNPFSMNEIPEDCDGLYDPSEYTKISVTVVDDDGVESVTVDATALGGSVNQPLTDEGDGTYSFRIRASASTLPGMYDLRVTATDVTGAVTDDVCITVVVIKNGDVNGDELVNSLDVLMLLQYLGDPESTAIQWRAAEVVVGESGIDICDAVLLLNHCVNPSGYVLG